MSELDEMRDKVTNLFADIFWDGYNKWHEIGRDYPFNEKYDELLSLSTDACRIAVVRKEGEYKVPPRREYKRITLTAYNEPAEVYLQGQIDAQQDMLYAGWVKEQHD